ncbi:glycine zipper domain-containing protein [Parasedimentitalea psychrophila]|uniref:Glycine zipper domain-containing protein n=1 Tax=Parasedimentitalea psychrophila TaxID=2997337 RepID=A0A9Y2KW52_9RHOB|nr:glycine zipper domain-containing protein [Parasedimentitalea psychrophila]WIY24266.1 glycine zipper domain-containing protein [Parasedimentitalea psychrophila]
MTYLLTHRRMIGVASALALCATFSAPLPVEAGIIGKRALQGAVAGAVIAEVTNGDPAQGAAIGAAVGAVSGAITKSRVRKRVRRRAGRPRRR